MSGETIVVFGTQMTLQTGASGAVANGAVAATANGYDIVANGSSFPDADFVLAVLFTVAPAENSVIALYAQPASIDGANSAQQPEATRPTIFIGSFVVNDVTTVQYIQLSASNVPKNALYYVHNSGTGQSMSAGWTLKVTPRSYKAAP